MKDKEKKGLSGCTVIPALFAIAIVFTAWALLTQGPGKPAKPEQATATATPVSAMVLLKAHCPAACTVTYTTVAGQEQASIMGYFERSYIIPTGGKTVQIRVRNDAGSEVACNVTVDRVVRDYQEAMGVAHCSTYIE